MKIEIKKIGKRSVHFEHEGKSYALNKWGLIVVNNGTPSKPFYQHTFAFSLQDADTLARSLGRIESYSPTGDAIFNYRKEYPK